MLSPLTNVASLCKRRLDKANSSMRHRADFLDLCRPREFPDEACLVRPDVLRESTMFAQEQRSSNPLRQM